MHTTQQLVEIKLSHAIASLLNYCPSIYPSKVTQVIKSQSPCHRPTIGRRNMWHILVGWRKWGGDMNYFRDFDEFWHGAVVSFAAILATSAGIYSKMRTADPGTST